MKNSILILSFIVPALFFDVHKCIAQDISLINTFNAVISKVDRGFSVDTTSIKDKIYNVQIDSLNNFYFAIAYIDTTDWYTRYGKIYVLKYDNHQFSIIDSTSSFGGYASNNLQFDVCKDSLFIHFEKSRQLNDYTYVFNKQAQIYQLVDFDGTYTYTHRINNKNDEDEYSVRRELSSDYNVKKQLLLWKINGVEEYYKKSGKKKIILPKDFPVQLRQFKTPLEMDDFDSILNQIDK